MGKQHYGTVVREGREKQRMTQAQLAAAWPKDDGGVGVSIGFVQLVEAGKKTITSERTKRGLCNILHVEPWRFGLADYDPENPLWVPQQKRLLDQSLEFAEYAIKRFEDSYRTAPLPKAAADAKQLHDFFEYIRQHQPPGVQNEQRFLRLYAQSLTLDSVVLKGVQNAGRTGGECQRRAEYLSESANHAIPPYVDSCTTFCGYPAKRPPG